MIRLEIPLEPLSWVPARVGRTRTYDIRSKYKNDVVLLLKAQYKGPMLKGPLIITMSFELPIPASTSKKKRAQMIAGEIYHTARPDASNCAKLHEDCLQKAGLIENDSHVVAISSKKYYSETPKTIITIEELV